VEKDKKDFFDQVNNIFLISLFYTGSYSEEKFNYDILSKSAKSDETEDANIRKVEYYTVVKKLKAGKCPYKDRDNDKCPICRDHLNEVLCLYDSDEKDK
jgi:hypothetical protein